MHRREHARPRLKLGDSCSTSPVQNADRRGLLYRLLFKELTGRPIDISSCRRRGNRHTGASAGRVAWSSPPTNPQNLHLAELRDACRCFAPWQPTQLAASVDPETPPRRSLGDRLEIPSRSPRDPARIQRTSGTGRSVGAIRQGAPLLPLLHPQLRVLPLIHVQLLALHSFLLSIRSCLRRLSSIVRGSTVWACGTA